MDGASAILNKGCRGFSQSSEKNSRVKPRLCCDFLESPEQFVTYKSWIKSYRCRFWRVLQGGSCHESFRWLQAFYVINMSCSRIRSKTHSLHTHKMSKIKRKINMGHWWNNNWQKQTTVLGYKPAMLPHGPPQSLYTLSWGQTRSPTTKTRRLNAGVRQGRSIQLTASLQRNCVITHFTSDSNLCFSQ